MESLGEVLTEVWRRAVTRQPVPEPATVLALAGVAVVLLAFPPVARAARHATTLVHEVGHATVGLLAGRRLTGIRLHTDASGLTSSSGRARGPGMVLTLLAGYPAPTVTGLAGAWLLGYGYAAGLLWGFVALCAVLVLFVRNVAGWLLVLALGGGVAVASWLLPPAALVGVAHVLLWMLLLTAPRAVLDLARGRRRRRDRSSDAARLASLTGVPAGVWVLVVLLLTLAGPALLAWLLLR